MTTADSARSRSLAPLVVPGAIAGAFYILVLTQLLQQFNFNPTGLIRIGDHFDGSRFTTSTTIVRPGPGYDGQFFFYIASEPALRASDPERFLDQPSYRYGRILYPALSWALAFGRPAALPWAMLAVNVLAAIAGTIATGVVLRTLRIQPWAALLFAYNPAMVIGVIGDLAEPVALALLATGFALYVSGRHRTAGTALAFATLAREASAIVSIGFAIDAVRRRASKEVAAYLLPLALPIAWHLSVWYRLGALPMAQSPGNFGWPFSGVAYRIGFLLGLRAPIVNEPPVANPWPELTIVAVSGAAIVVGLVWIVRHRDVFAIQYWLQAAMAVCTTSLVWVGVSSYGRVLGPFYLACGLAVAAAWKRQSLPWLTTHNMAGRGTM
ncbi:MAG TPA: hypothetical protein VFV95_08530 [Vicinamibacterales bacterium]|nr:hypothetical protein [Vicinamibacterales bacterium]